MFLKNPEDARELFGSLNGTLVGVGMTAYARIIPAYLLEKYHIVCLKKTRDLPLFRRKGEVFCLEEEMGGPIRDDDFNSTKLLAHPLVKKFLRGLPGPKYLLLYQNYNALEPMAKKEGWHLVGNQGTLRVQIDDRRFFRQLIRYLKLPEIQGDIYPIEEIHVRGFEQWTDALGPGFAVQLPEISQGGGRGTFFIQSASDYNVLCERLKENTWRGIHLDSVSIRHLEDGIPASIAVCLTEHGQLLSGLQRQLIDLHYCRDIPEDGIFCGHAWDNAFRSESVIKEAQDQACLIGKHIASMGYRGIFGIDFVIQMDNERVWPIEINPRFTGAFPMISQLHILNGIIPMDVFHILEFMGMPYEVDIEELNSMYAKPLRGSHVLMFNVSQKDIAEENKAGAGLYELDPVTGTVTFIKGAFDYGDIKNDRQFIIIDGPPDTGTNAFGDRDPLSRICRILFPYSVVDDAGDLVPNARRVIDELFGSPKADH